MSDQPGEELGGRDRQVAQGKHLSKEGKHVDMLFIGFFVLIFFCKF